MGLLMGQNGKHGGDPNARTRFLNSRLGEGRGFLEEGRYADAAQAFTIAAEYENDTITRQMRLEAAKICATLRLADAVEESTATMKDTWKRQSEAAERLREVA